MDDVDSARDRNGTGKRPRLEDVAARVGLSTASVSLVLRGVSGPSERTRQRVLKAAAELGYQVDRTASLLASRRTRLLGVMVDVHRPFHAELVEHLHTAAEAVGYDLVLSTQTRTRDEHTAVETLLAFRSEAMILLGPTVPADTLAALDRKSPVIAVGRRIADAALDVVRTADDDGVGQIVDHLVGLGHRAITYVDGGKGVIATDRRRGYRTAMRHHGLDAHIRVLHGDHTEAAGERAARKLLDGDALPTAVVTYNDQSAIGVLAALARAGVAVPGQVSVAGYDDDTLSRLSCFNLTTVSQNAEEQARHAVAAAVERLDHGRTEPREVVLPPHLVIRGTTAEPA
ncbi:LacI family DNA-binding transcriptional regulator [Streptomyces phaeochromogenes]|uniref:LacI family transcriptional regulator n=1 Tax=Streptomyces phaeochromogenes TaxID=1923 RepID=A0ABZ1H4T1_STRPH|nr:LacI family DNA-binding transcriptional regulator [Streptomyces phaeochromogenes]MCX5602163.1 LacI family transcriptional regulator [Streptomyces phaeochromogenes]WSD12617.1 LacI family transcriptional regulator [Streptomyces phaeochromogenes]WSJ10587.1 LacI family transcriptional regulator [Streptomyces phaeochromogenes]WSS91359.1 LacI family transcriptional regulator [Streptomyces phaeochromogenes]WSW19914.1 LacI family transcriptional regulator [Streptomyces phaeochromogenes]